MSEETKADIVMRARVYLLEFGSDGDTLFDQLIEELANEVEARRASEALLGASLKKADAEIERLRTILDVNSSPAVNRQMYEALTFSADPESYFAIGFLPDKPCGDFADDFSDDHGHEDIKGFRPGRRARAAIAAMGYRAPANVQDKGAVKDDKKEGEAS